MTDDCWHKDDYGVHCWQPLPSNLPHETVERCEVCGETRGEGAQIVPEEQA